MEIKKKDKRNAVILNWLLFSILLICISVNLTWKWQSIPGGIVHWQLDWSVSSTLADKNNPVLFWTKENLFDPLPHNFNFNQCKRKMCCSIKCILRYKRHIGVKWLWGEIWYRDVTWLVWPKKDLIHKIWFCKQKFDECRILFCMVFVDCGRYAFNYFVAAFKHSHKGKPKILKTSVTLIGSVMQVLL